MSRWGALLKCLLGGARTYLLTLKSHRGLMRQCNQRQILTHASAPSIYSQGVSRETWGQSTFGKSINKDCGGSMPEKGPGHSHTI